MRSIRPRRGFQPANTGFQDGQPQDHVRQLAFGIFLPGAGIGGHFGMEAEDGMPVFRHAVLLRGAPGASAESLEDMIDIAITECERFFPAFQFVLWGGKAPAEALELAMLECVGEA